MSKLYLEIFSPERLSLFKKLEAFVDIGILSGGTAIALQIKHRKSFDFDIFIQSEITQKLRDKIERVFTGRYCVIRDEKFQLDIAVDDIKVTFVRFAYKYILPLVVTQYLPLFNLANLASNKAFAIGRRGTWRDYIDLYFLLKEKYVNMENLLQDEHHGLEPYDPITAQE